MVHTAEIEFNNKGNYDATVGYEWQIGKMYNIAGFGGTGMVMYMEFSIKATALASLQFTTTKLQSLRT